MPFLYLLLPSLCSMIAVSKCLPQARWEEHEGSWPTASAPQCSGGSDFLLAVCCVPISSLPSNLPFADCLPLCIATGLLDYGISLTLLYVSVCTWDLSVCLRLCLPRFSCMVRVVFSSSVLWSQYLSDPLGPLLLMTCQESFKGTQGWNYGVIGINMQAAISGSLCCVIAKETSNHEWEGFPGDQRVTDQWISFFVGQTGGICSKGLFHWSLKPTLLRLIMAE